MGASDSSALERLGNHRPALLQDRLRVPRCAVYFPAFAVRFGPTSTEYVWPIRSEYRTLPAPEQSISSVARCHNGTASFFFLGCESGMQRCAILVCFV